MPKHPGPLPAALALGKAAVPVEPRLHGGWLYWLEQRPAEAGRTTLLRRRQQALSPGSSSTPTSETLELTRQALWLVLMLSGPPIAAAAIVGLVVAFLQAATQIQEQTFAYALKFVAIVLALFVTGAMIGGTLYTYSNRIFIEFPSLIRR